MTSKHVPAGRDGFQSQDRLFHVEPSTSMSDGIHFTVEGKNLTQLNP